MDERDNETKDLVITEPSQVVANQSQDIAQKIVDADDVDEVKKLTDMFNLLQQKKNILRILKLNGLYDAVTEQMGARFEKKADEFSNTELLNYLQVVQNALDKSNNGLKLVSEIPPINFNQQNNVNINVGDEFSREERERIADALKAILQRQQSNQQETPEDIIIEEPKAEDIVSPKDENGEDVE